MAGKVRLLPLRGGGERTESGWKLKSSGWELVANKDEWGHESTNAANKFIIQLEAERAN